nr:uncharacterized protein LOC109152125 [Ipomoea batatas]
MNVPLAVGPVFGPVLKRTDSIHVISLQSSFVNPSSGKSSFMVERSVLESPRKRAINVALMVLSPGWCVVLLATPSERRMKRCASTRDGPEQVLPHGFSIKNVTVNVNQFSINDIIHGEAVFSHHIAISAATNMATHSNSWAHTSREAMHIALIGNCVQTSSSPPSDMQGSELSNIVFKSPTVSTQPEIIPSAAQFPVPTFTTSPATSLSNVADYPQLARANVPTQVPTPSSENTPDTPNCFPSAASSSSSPSSFSSPTVQGSS